MLVEEGEFWNGIFQKLAHFTKLLHVIKEMGSAGRNTSTDRVWQVSTTFPYSLKKLSLLLAANLKVLLSRGEFAEYLSCEVSFKTNAAAAWRSDLIHMCRTNQ